MKPVSHLAAAFSLLLAAPSFASETQSLTSPNQVPDGLAKSDWQSIREAYEAGRHAFQPVEGGWQARNPGQQWSTKFDQRGFVVQPSGASWQWGLELTNYGFGDHQTTISGTPEVKVDGQRLSYQWDATVEEWFVNDQRGLEHGFIVSQRPTGEADAPLSFTLGIRGGLQPQVTPDTLGVTFHDENHVSVLTYTGLKVWDADGKILASRFELDGDNRVKLLVEERGARYPITIDPIAQQAYLKASNTGASDRFGWSVAISGDTVAVGAPGEASEASGVGGNQANNSAQNSGAVYVFKRTAGAWIQEAYLKASNTGQNDQFGDGFGYSVAVSGDTVVVGAHYEDSSATGVGGNQTDNSAIRSGAAYVFIRSTGIWTQQAYLKASNTESDDRFGISVAISGDTVVVGADQEDSSAIGVGGNQANNSAENSGAAYVFIRSTGVWSQQAYLKASNTGALDSFGWSVAVSGDTVVIGAPGEASNASGVGGNQANNSASSSGAAYLFTRSAGVWTQQAYLKASNTEGSDKFGFSVAVSGDIVIASAPFEASNATGVGGNQLNNSAFQSGAAYIYKRVDGAWAQEAYLKASNTGAYDEFGYSVAVSGDTVVVGAHYEDSSTTGLNSTPNESASDSGAAYVFIRSAGIWSQQAYIKASNTGADDYFGYSVAVSADSAIVGAYGEDSSTTGYNSTPNESATWSGAAYIFNGIPFSQIEQEITFPELPDRILKNGTSVNLTATSSSGFLVTYTVVEGPATLSGSTLTLTGPGTVTVRASQAGNFVYTAATPVERSFTVSQSSQEITFNTVAERLLKDGATVTLNATASSGLPVTYAVLSGPATLSGNTLTLTGVGTVTVRASQAGDLAYTAATPVERSFTVTQSTQTITFPALADRLLGDGTTVALNATASSGLPVSYAVLSGPATLSGTTLTLTGVGTVTVRASQPGDLAYSAATPEERSFTVSQSTQTVTFTPITNYSVSSGPLVLSATSSSGLPVEFTLLSGPASLGTDGKTLTFTGESGTVVIRITQTGGTAYAAAAIETSFTVSGTTSGGGDGDGDPPAVNEVTTLAGFAGLSGSVDGSGSAALFYEPHKLAIDAAGNIYVADRRNHVIRKVSPTGSVTTLAGAPGVPGFADGTGSAARFRFPSGIAVDPGGNVFVADTDNHRIRKISPGGTVSTVAGSSSFGNRDDVGTLATFTYPTGLALDGDGTLYVTHNHSIRKISTSGSVTTLAGSTLNGSGTSDGTGTNARFDFPVDLVVDTSGNIFVADLLNHTIRKITPSGIVSTFAGLAGSSGGTNGTGSTARFADPAGITIDSLNNLYVTDRWNHTIHKISPEGLVTQLAGTMRQGGTTNGPTHSALFRGPSDVAVDSFGSLYVADRYNHTIRKITLGSGGDGSGSGVTPLSPNAVITLAGKSQEMGQADGTGAAARFNEPTSVALDSIGNLYVADAYNHSIRKITPSGSVSTLAGSPDMGSGSANGSGSAARFDSPTSVTVDSSGNLYVADTGNHTIRKITPGGVVSTLAGSSGVSGSANGTGTAARFNSPEGVAVDALGNLYVADTGNHSIRRIAPDGEVTTFAGVSGSEGTANGSGANARFESPEGLAVDVFGNLYVADTGNQIIRKITPAGNVTTYANTTHNFVLPSGVAVDTLGNVYVADTWNHTIRKINPDGVVSIVAGFTDNEGYTDAVGTDARFYLPEGIAVDAAGNLYVADTWNHTIRKIGSSLQTGGGGGTYGGGGVTDTPIPDYDNYIVTTLAGMADSNGTTNGSVSTARFNGPWGIAVDSNFVIYVSDHFNHTIRKITPEGVVTTFVGSPGQSGSADGSGSAARFNRPTALTIDAEGNLYVADSMNSTVRKVTSAGLVSTLAGAVGQPGSVNGTGNEARFNSIQGLAASPSGVVYVSELPGNTVRRISQTGTVTTVKHPNDTNVVFDKPSGLTVDSELNLYVADTFQFSPDPLQHVIRKITSAGQFTSVPSSPGAFGIPQVIANTRHALCVDNSGNLYVADPYRFIVRKFPSTGPAYTIAGASGQKGSQDSSDGTGYSARLDNPEGIAVDRLGHVYITDFNKHTVRKITGVATLSSLALSAGTINPTFTSSTTEYSLSVANEVTSTTVTPSATHVGATVRVGGAVVATGTSSASIPLNVGSNLISVEVTAERGVNIKTYTVDIQRAASDTNVDPLTLCYVDPYFEPRIGNQLALDLTRLSSPGETIKIVGKLPSGLEFNAATGLLSGILTGIPGSYPLTVQFLQGKTVIRTVSLPITVLPYPSTLLGSFHALLEDEAGIPTGVVRLSITKVGAWSAMLEGVGMEKRSAKGSFLLNQQSPTIELNAVFAASGAVPAKPISIQLDADSPLVNGTHDGGTLRGFRMAQGSGNPASGALCNLALDAGVQDGINKPAGIGWLTGKFGKTGSVAFKGILGDGTRASISLEMSATGQALFWLQPYSNNRSFLGGIVTLPDLGQSPSTSERLEEGLWWSKAADIKSLSYPAGFDVMPVEVLAARWTAASSATLLGSALGWTDGRTASLFIDGAGLSNAEPQDTSLLLPTALTLDDKFNLNATAPQEVAQIPWLGKANNTNGNWTGTFTLPVGFVPDIITGKATTSGVLLPSVDAGYGLIIVPVSGPKGSFRTAAAVLND